MHTPPELRAKAAASYNAAADWYDAPANSFWSRFGRASVERAAPKAGDRVLDVCCGSGASVLPAAERVAPGGLVTGIDVAEALLARARDKARAAGLHHVSFRVGDLLATGEPDAAYDVVLCVFGIFFAPDIPAAARELWRLVRPGGTLVVTTWGARLFEPMNGVFWAAVREVRPELHKGFNPWDRIADPGSLTAVLHEAGVPGVQVEVEEARHPLHSPDDWWTLVLGSGYRGTVDQLSVAERAAVREACARHFAAAALDGIEANVLYATARRPPEHKDPVGPD